MKKGWLIGCSIAGVAALLLCGGFVGLMYYGVTEIFALTKPVVDGSEGFLSLLGQNKTAEAYASTASGFRAQMSEADFTAAVKKVGLDDYASASWNNRNVNNQDGSVEGTVTSKKGGTTPVAIRLVYEQAAWKVVGVRYGGVELTDVRAPKQVPPEADLRRMVKDALLDFNEAVSIKDFTGFFGRLSSSFQKEATPAKLQQAFQEFIDKGLDIGSIKNLDPQLDPPPAIDGEGVLVVEGRYPTQPSAVQFTLKYVDEAGVWKLNGIHVKVGEGK